MPIKSLSGNPPPIGTVIESFSDTAYKRGEEVQLQNLFGDPIARLKCLGKHEPVKVDQVGGYQTDVARGCYKFEVIE